MGITYLLVYYLFIVGTSNKNTIGDFNARLKATQ